MRFGFLYEHFTYTTKYLTITPLKGTEEEFEVLKEETTLQDGWIYPPIDSVDYGKKPVRNVLWYSLPCTHEINFSCKANKELKEFIILFFGFLKGIILRPEKWGHYYRTPYKSMLIGFHAEKETIEKLLDMAVDFYNEHRRDGILTKYYAALHWYLFSQTYYHEFEKFDGQYKVLDSCYRICKKIFEIKSKSHSDRLENLCEYFEIPKPSFAPKISKIRNDFFHESLFAGAPIGFNPSQDNISLELSRINERLFLLILGVDKTKFPNELLKFKYRLKI